MGQPATYLTKFRVSNGKLLSKICLGAFVAIVGSALWGDQTRTDFTLFIETSTKHYGEEAQSRAIAWRDHLATLETAKMQEQLTSVNQFFNQRVRWRSDYEIYGVEDFWATPAEMLGRGTGDCEDFTIAKYVSLRHLGVPAEQLRLTYVQLKVTATRTQAHMVLAWYPKPNTTPLILDNANPRILPASDRKDLKPIFSFNSEELWLGNSRSATNASPSSRISQWRQMVARAEREGVLL